MTVKDLDDLLLESKYSEYQYLVKGPIITNWSDGLPRQEPKIIVFQFERYMLDVGAECERMELDDEDREYVVRQIERSLKDPDQRTDLWIHQKPVAAPPWPTYEKMHHNQIPTFAAQIGLLAEALAYEQRRPDPRPSVIAKLEELSGDTGTVVAEDDFAAV